MEIKSTRYHLPHWSILAIGIISLILIYFLVWPIDSPGYRSIIGGDGKDYYSYLVSLFIDKNLGHQDTSPWYITQTPTGTINVHTIGVSLLLLPFFGIACLWASLGGYPVNGISEPFEKMVSLGALAYLLVGIYFLRKLLLLYGIKSRTVGLILLLVFFGTNLLNYSLQEPSMSHVYSFSLIATFLYFAKRLFENPLPKYSILCAVILGLIVLVRPANVLILVALPVLAANSSSFIQVLRQVVIKNYKSFLVALFAFLAVIFLQSLVWYNQNGKLIQWTYQDNGFYFLNPQLLKMLFGFNSGFFIYTPLFLLFFTGIFFWHKRNKFQARAALLFFLFLFYFLSSYWGYTYNDGLGIRPLCDYYALLAIPGAMLFDAISEILKKVFLSLLSMLVLIINLVYCWQYKTGILLAANMDYAKWSYIFLHTDKTYRNVLGGLNDLQPYSVNPVLPFVSYSDTAEGVDSTLYRKLFDLPKTGIQTNKLFVKIKLGIRELYKGSSQNAFIVLKTSSPEGVERNSQSTLINEVPFAECCKWKTWEYNIVMTGDVQKDDRFEVFLLNQKKEPFSLNNFQISIFNYNTNRNDHN